MSTHNETPTEEKNSADIGREGFPLRDESNDDVALALAEQKQDAIAAVDAVNWSLLDDQRPLTDEKVQRLSEVGNALTALSRTLSLRVPDEHRAKTEDEHQQMYGGE